MAPALAASALAFLPMISSDSAAMLVYTVQVFFPAARSSHNAVFSTGIYFFPLFFRIIAAYPSGSHLNVISSEKPSLILSLLCVCESLLLKILSMLLYFPPLTRSTLLTQILSACKGLASHPLIYFIADFAMKKYVFICVIFV